MKSRGFDNIDNDLSSVKFDLILKTKSLALTASLAEKFETKAFKMKTRKTSRKKSLKRSLQVSDESETARVGNEDELASNQNVS